MAEIALIVAAASLAVLVWLALGFARLRSSLKDPVAAVAPLLEENNRAMLTDLHIGLTTQGLRATVHALQRHARRLRAAPSAAHRIGDGGLEVSPGELPPHVRPRGGPGGARARAKAVQGRYPQARRRHCKEIHHRGRNLRRRGDVRPGGGRVRRDPRLPSRGRRVRDRQARVDRLADDADGGAEHGARCAERRGDAPAYPHHPRGAGQARRRFPAFRRAHEEARRPHPPGAPGRRGRAGLQSKDLAALPADRSRGNRGEALGQRGTVRAGQEVIRGHEMTQTTAHARCQALLEVMRNRLTTRQFDTGCIVPREHYDLILEAARHAPSGANAQPWHYIIVTAPETKKKIADYFVEEQRRRAKLKMKFPTPNYRGLETAPGMIVVGADFRFTRAFPVLMDGSDLDRQYHDNA